MIATCRRCVERFNPGIVAATDYASVYGVHPAFIAAANTNVPAPAGEYKVLVTWFEKETPVEGEGLPLTRSLLPSRYDKFTTSGLTLRVEEGENQNLA